ncbi:MAG: PAS domain-containing protein, partial [Verrucomicrobiales bacterium]|nr:PAS domain-containing protein [Verrucomicrobiales bacterium]
PLRTGRSVGFSAFVRDITMRKRAEETLARERNLLRTLIDNLPAYIYLKDTEGRYVVNNRANVRAIRAESEAATLGKTVFDFFAEETARLYDADDRRVLATGQPLLEREVLTQDHEGNERWLLTTKLPLWDGHGAITGLLGISLDVTERKRAGQKLRTQLERLNLLDQITRAIGQRQDLKSIFQVVCQHLEAHLPIDFACVCLYDKNQNSLKVAGVGRKSQSLAQDLATPEGSLISVDRNGLSRCVAGQLLYEPETDRAEFPFSRRLATGGLHSFVAAPLLVESNVFGVLLAARLEPRSFNSADCEFLRQLSEHVALAAHHAQLHGVLRQAYDDLRQTQQVAMQQERLRAIGQMASGIAHDINNAISPATLYTESLLENEPNLSARAREYLTTIQRALDDVAGTVARMREFYRQREPQVTLTPVPLNTLVEQVVSLTRARWSDMPQQRGHVIQTQTDLAPDLPSILGIESEIREALTNLIFNAADAMPNGGTLTLRTRVSASQPGPGEPACSPYVQVEVTDTGSGMDEATRRRCLEPFFTTKGERGTGLGLAMVYGTMQRHGGEVEIESTPGQGTTVRLSFPLRPAELADPPKAEMSRTTSSPLRILVVDDDSVLLKSLSDTLEADGHAVVAAHNGRVGIDTFLAAQQGNDPFAIVITDLGMPYVDGVKVASAVKEASASTPVILLTGWGQRAAGEGDVPPHVDRVLSKPPKLHELREALAHCCPRASA